MSPETHSPAAQTPDRIEVMRHGTVGTVVLNHPGRRNALTREMCIALSSAMADLDRDPDIKVIALRGAGQDFSAGAAINDLKSVLFDDSAKGPIDRLSQADAAICAIRKPTIALVRGVCMGGGWQIASACDIILAADDTRIAITPSKLGFLYPRLGLERLAERVGIDRAKHLIFTAQEIDPAQAAAWGLITELIDADKFEEHATEVLRTISDRSQYSIVTMKRLLAETAQHERKHAAWDTAWRAVPDNPDLAIGRAAFLSRTTPHFTWQSPVS